MQGRVREAEACFRKAIELQDDSNAVMDESTGSATAQEEDDWEQAGEYV